MIRFSFSSFYMSLFFANIMIFILYLIFRNQKLMIKLGLPMLGTVLLVTILRMLLPFEFLFLSRNIYFPENISMLIGRFISPRFLQERFSFWSFVKLIWFSGIIISAVHFTVSEYKLIKKIKDNSSKLPESDLAYQIFHKIQEENPKLRHIEIRVLPNIYSPAICGLWKPVILMPEGLVLNETELYYILHHEVSHYLHHDILLKLSVNLLCIIYWWNPFCRSLLSNTNEVLEMRVDKNIALHPDQKVEYLNCLLMIAEFIPESKPNTNTANTISLCKATTDNLLPRRFKMLLYEEKNPLRTKLRNCILLLFLVGVFLLSFVFIFEASYNGIQDSIEAIVPDMNNCYFIKREDGKYDLYMDEEYIGTADSPEYFSEDIPIY